MVDDSPKRVVARVLTRDVLAAFGQITDRYGMDMLDFLVFSGVWTANTAHLTDAQVYAGTFDVPPDEVRRPVSLGALAKALRMEPALVAERVAGLIAGGLVAKVEGGLVVPSAVFGRPEMLDGIELAYVRTMQMVQALEDYGVVEEVKRLRGRAKG